MHDIDLAVFLTVVSLKVVWFGRQLASLKCVLATNQKFVVDNWPYFFFQRYVEQPFPALQNTLDIYGLVLDMVAGLCWYWTELKYTCIVLEIYHSSLFQRSRLLKDAVEITVLRLSPFSLETLGQRLFRKLTFLHPWCLATVDRLPTNEN